MSTTLKSQGRNRPPTASPRHTRRRATALVAAASLLVAGASAAIAQITTPNPVQLKAVGPISGEHGYPTWYEDSNGLRLEQCLDLEDPFCDPAFLRDEMPDPDAPISFPDNWPLESFYFLAGAEAAMPGGGKAVLTAGLEATMANEASVDGDQVVFGRLRFDIDFPGAGTYEVIHPYGVDTFEVSAAEADSWRYVEDITAAPGNFGLALRSRINPFLVREAGIIETTDGNRYVGDPAETTRVTGSPIDDEHNVFSVNRVNLDGSRSPIGSTDLFSLMGKVSTNSGVTPQGAFLVETDTERYLDVFATTDAGDSVSVSGDGILKTTLVGDGDRYFGRIPLSEGTTAPGTVVFSNDSDKPVATKEVTVTDRVTITSATYDTGTGDLTVSASSSDELEPPTLSVEGVTMDSLGTATITTAAPPATVTVSSTGGGSDSAPVMVTGATTTPPAAPLAVISGPTEVLAGSQVTLTSASQNATQLLWSQTAGADVGVTGQTDQTVTFAAPSEEGTLAFTLTATGPGGTHIAGPFEIKVMTTLPAPVAVATATPNAALVGQTVTLSGAGTTGAETYAWSQTSGPVVMIANASSSTATFTMPAGTDPLEFRLLVTSPDGVQTATALVTVTPVRDTLTVAAGAQYRADKQEWRINGTATVTNNNTVRVYLVDTTTQGKGTEIGSGAVDALGAWEVRVKQGVPAPNGNGPIPIIVESTRGGTTTGTVARR